MLPNSLAGLLLTRQLRSSGWSYFGSPQSSVEATTLAVMALSTESSDAARSGLGQVFDLQRRDGAWPAFVGDSEASCTTALVLCALNGTVEFASAREKAFRWLVSERGREGHWFWRWKFKTLDRNVQFDPDKYGWPWESGSASWVIPTAFSVIALKQYTICNRLEASEKRIQLGLEMLLDRVCVGGGWNSGNSIVYGVPLRPHVEETAIALLALQDEPRPEMAGITGWRHGGGIQPGMVHSDVVCVGKADRGTEAQARGIPNNATLATALLALRCGEMIHPFMVLR
jgi:hypothetical protein